MKSLKHLNKYFFKYRYRFLTGIFFVVVSNVFAVYAPQVVRYAFDLVNETYEVFLLLNGFSLQQSLMNFFAKTAFLLGMLYILLAVFRGVFLFLMRQTLIVMSRHIEYDLKNEIFKHYESLSLSFYKKNNTGDLMNRISEDVSRVRMYLGPAIMYSINERPFVFLTHKSSSTNNLFLTKTSKKSPLLLLFLVLSIILLTMVLPDLFSIKNKLLLILLLFICLVIIFWIPSKL